MFIFYYDPTTAKITRQGFFKGSQPLQVVWVTVHDYNSVYMCVCLIPYYIVRKNLELVTIGPQRIKQNVEGSELTGILQYGNLKIHLQERRLKEIMTFPDSQDLGNFLKIFR